MFAPRPVKDLAPCAGGLKIDCPYLLADRRKGASQSHGISQKSCRRWGASAHDVDVHVEKFVQGVGQICEIVCRRILIKFDD